MGTEQQLKDIARKHIAEGLSVDESFARLRKEHPEFFSRQRPAVLSSGSLSPLSRHYDASGNPVTFEGAVSLNIRKHKMTPDRAVRAAGSSFAHLQRDYYERLKGGNALNLDDVLGGGELK